MSTAGDFAELKRRLDTTTDKSLFLGRLVWYWVSDVKVTEPALGKLLHAEGLGVLAPPPPLDADVFKRVCTAAQRKGIPTADPQVIDNYLVRKIGRVRDKNLCARVVRERVDTAKNELLFETELCLLTWDNGQIMTAHQGDDVVARQIAHDIVTNFNAMVGTVTSTTVRDLIRKALLTKGNAVNVRGPNGGVYFVSETNAAIVDSLERLAPKIPGDVVVHSLPLMDDGKQREMLKRAYESETIDDVAKWMAEVADLLQADKKISDDELLKYIGLLNRAKAKAKEYADLLEDSLGDASIQVSIFQKQVMALGDKAATEGTRKKRGQ